MRTLLRLLVGALAASAVAACGSAARDVAAAPSPSGTYTWAQDCGVTGYEQYPHLADDDRYAADEYVGLSLPEAERRAREARLEVRVLGQDGDCTDRTDDLRDDRINFYVEAGEVRSAARY